MREPSDYQLYLHCKLVVGTSGRGAIYDLHTGRVFSVNQKSVQIIQHERADDQGYWQKLEETGLARQGDTTSVPEVEMPMLREFNDKEATLKFVWCEITSDCNQRCLHCYGSFGKSEEYRTSPVNWDEVLEQSAQLGCKQVQFIGGEPLLVQDLLFELIALAHQLDFSFIEVFTNGTLITPQVAQYFRDNRVHAAISIYSNHPEIHDSITQQQGSFQGASKGLRLLAAEAVPVRVAVIAVAQNQDTLEATMDYARKCGARCTRPDVVRPTGRGSDCQLLPRPEIVARYAMRDHPNFSTGWKSFMEAKYWNTCWKGKCAITPTGDVLPCIFARNTVAGNVNQISLASLVETMLPYWHTTLDKVAICQACEYRYACHNCRPLSESATGDILGRNPRCTYDPYTGTWEGEKTNDCNNVAR